MKKTSNISLIALTVLTVMMTYVVPQRASAQLPETYFPYPTPPDSLVVLQDRCNYLLEHFWERCDLTKAFSSKQKMRQAFADYLSFMPFADAETVYASIGQFTKALDKQPDDLLFIADEAEAQLMGDSAQYYSEEVYIPFAQAVVDNKRVDKTVKLRYSQQVNQLKATQPGTVAPDLTYTDREGNTRHLADDKAQMVVVFFSDPDCGDCRIARVQLDANIQATRLIANRVIKIVCLTPCDYSQEWAESVASYPQEWTVGAAPEADIVYHITGYPSFYIMDRGHKIHAKNYTVDQLLQVISRLDQKANEAAASE